MRQLSLLEKNIDTISFSKIISELKVTESTIKNWIITENLSLISPYEVSEESYIKFKETILGKSKLNKRANKLHLDETNESKISKNISNMILDIYAKKSSISADELSTIYEKMLGNSYKNEKGIYYTPLNIAKNIIEPFINNIELTFCDPCCGTGNFLIAAIDAGIIPENIYGFDLDENAVKIAKARIFEKTGFNSNTIFAMDFLKCEDFNELNKFDLVFTNPPWGKKFSNQEKNSIFLKYNKGKKIDSSAVFSLACIESAKENGYVGLLLPESFFNVLAFSPVRQKLLEQKIICLTDHGKPFEGLQTRAQSIVIKKESYNENDSILCHFESKKHFRKTQSFKNNPNYICNFYTSEEEEKVIDHLYKQTHITLENNAKWGLGIVTGNNEACLSNTQLENYIPVFKGSDILKNQFKQPTNYITRDFSKFQQVAPLELYQAKEKIIYKFISSNLSFALDKNQRMILNSANLLILKQNLPISHEQLVFILNTKLINWLFNKIFRTHKVLRSDLEKLPIHVNFFKDTKIITEKSFQDFLGVEEHNGTFRLKK